MKMTLVIQSKENMSRFVSVHKFHIVLMDNTPLLWHSSYEYAGTLRYMYVTQCLFEL